ncbi:Dual specificity phosphatase domain containing protein [Aphelenchoides besseyi]|nr:Dual specificity phosphatase domain containing protein [Aphelenchoides besseyi]KAI6227946.1 Dual specificity phosphatase domain containing protein [Aphelenchoides besseyi]
MAFDLAAAIQNAKGKLQNVVTKVTLQDGTEIEENRARDGTFQQIDDNADGKPVISNRRRKAVERAKRFGYVLDLKPDLQVARICSNVFLSSQDVVNNLELLRLNAITHIINAGVGITNVFPKQFVYMNLNILDLPDSDIKSEFPRVHRFIREAVDGGGSVLIHCNAGVSRSAALGISYLMRYHQLTFAEALQQVKSVRPAVRPNDGFHRQLQEYEKEIQLLQ